MMQLKKYISGKSVAVIGNSNNLMSYSYGREIDEHDIVIRMNRGILIPDTHCFGARTDIWCYSTYKLVKEIYPLCKCDIRVYMSPKERKLFKKGPENLFFPMTLWKSLNMQLSARPSVGAMVSYLLLQCEPRTVTFYGFDFKATKSFYEKKNNTGSHNFLKEKQLIQDISLKNNWIMKECSKEYKGNTKFNNYLLKVKNILRIT
ncbi:glycosyltransferase family 29 protein [Pseudovibrio denitrificans]|uniref:glycosyltransferase family 29 protein n=1 Tax=Pseudovibrio denitrificans TaxID=258256 RepID=UPI0039BF74A1